MNKKNMCLLVLAAVLPAVVWAASVNLQDTESSWVLDSFLGEEGALQKVTVAQPPTLSFAPDGSVFGFSGVNQLRGTYTTENDSLTFSALAMTRRFALAEELNKLEAAYTALIGKTRRCMLELRPLTPTTLTPTLTLMGADGTVLLVFTRAENRANSGAPQ